MLKIIKIIITIFIILSDLNLSNSFKIPLNPISKSSKIYEPLRILNKSPTLKGQCLIDKHNNYETCDIITEDFYQKINLKNKKLINISPAGLQGFYLLGIIAYIKENYNTSDYIFSGASAGAFNALFATYKYGPIDIINLLDMEHILSTGHSINDLQKSIKLVLLDNFSTADFDLDKLFIGVTAIKNFQVRTNIYFHFMDLEDAIDACIASSNIPFITGPILHKYNNAYSFDGGFSKYPFLHLIEPVLHITADIWKPENNKKRSSMFNIISDFTTFFAKENYNFIDLYKKGYNDTLLNKDIINNIFIPNV